MKIKIALLTATVGFILFIVSWVYSYPVAIYSPHEFLYDNFSVYYWISIFLLLISFFILGIYGNERYKLLASILTFIIIYSKTLFYYFISGSDMFQFLGLQEQYLITGELIPNIYQEYYQWPSFFILHKLLYDVTGLNLNILQFIIYFIIGILLTFFLYRYSKKYGLNSYISVLVFYIILYRFLNVQWAPYTVSIIPFFLLLYLNEKYDSNINLLVIIITMIALSYYHILTPIICITYYLFKYITSKKTKYLTLFFISLIIYLLIQSSVSLFPHYLNEISNLEFFQIGTKVQISITEPVSKKPLIDHIAQFFSRLNIIMASIITGFGFILFFLDGKNKEIDRTLLYTGIFFTPTLLVSFDVYPNICWRILPLTFFPLMLGSSYILKRIKKNYVKIIFLFITILLTFEIMHESFYDNQIHVFRKKEHHNANYLLEHINYTKYNLILSHFRNMVYIRSKMNGTLYFMGDSAVDNLVKDNLTSDFDYIVYTVGLGKSYLNRDIQIYESIKNLDSNNYNLIYNSGSYSYIYNK